MKLNPKLKLRQVGRKYMVVDAEAGVSKMTNVFTLNASAAMLWGKIGTDSFGAEDLVRWLCEQYEVDAETARDDVDKLLRCWKDGGLVI